MWRYSYSILMNLFNLLKALLLKSDNLIFEGQNITWIKTEISLECFYFVRSNILVRKMDNVRDFPSHFCWIYLFLEILFIFILNPASEKNQLLTTYIIYNIIKKGKTRYFTDETDLNNSTICSINKDYRNFLKRNPLHCSLRYIKKFLYYKGIIRRHLPEEVIVWRKDFMK